MIKIPAKNFSLSQICESGQCFRMRQFGGGRYGLAARNRYLELSQEGEEILFHCPEEEYELIWREYFDLGTDYGAFIASVDAGDAYLKAAAAYGSGIRILRQDTWETLVSFIVSQQNHIKRIRKCIDLLCLRYGEERETGEGVRYHGFPSPERLSLVPTEELYECNLGYRSRYVRETARSIAAGEVDLEGLRTLDYAEAAVELKKLCGVGEKVAACICLFGLHHMDAFPRDTHINRVLRERYPSGFPSERYAGCAGVMQQYIFYYDLSRPRA